VSFANPADNGASDNSRTKPDHRGFLPPRDFTVCLAIGRVVGAVGIENNGGRDFKDLRGMRGNAKSSKRNDGNAKEFLLLP
jgi:hypothetical protein